MYIKNSKKLSKEKSQIKKIDRKIWWIETKVGWLRFISGKSVSEPLIYLVVIAPFFIFYLFFDKYLISKLSEQKLLKWLVIITLFFLSLYVFSIIDKKISKRIKFLEEKVNLLYKEKSQIKKIDRSLVVLSLLIFCFVLFLQNGFASNKYQVSFHNPSQMQVKTIKDYYNGQYPKEIYDDLSIDEVDLNDDKRNELFVYYGSSINCGTLGCNTEIFVFDHKQKIKKIFSESTYGQINILNNKSDGFKDLEIIAGTQHIKNVSNLFKWNKTSQNYQYQN